jgi:hypothetical protein
VPSGRNRSGRRRFLVPGSADVSRRLKRGSSGTKRAGPEQPAMGEIERDRRRPPALDRLALRLAQRQHDLAGRLLQPQLGQEAVEARQRQAERGADDQQHHHQLDQGVSGATLTAASW